jgi:hypothetical protein
MKKINLIQILFLGLIFSANTSFAANKCVHLFAESVSVIPELQKLQVPAGEISIYEKKIPVVLVNAKSVSELKDLYNQSLGIVVAHQKGYNNDHGLFRLGDFFIDRDSPGYRSRGEIHKTGISYAFVKDYVDYVHQHKNSPNRIEVLFKLSPLEFQTAVLYQKMRRAAILRPDFSFGADSNPKNINNRMQDCGEICFSFSTGSNARSQADSAVRQIEKTGLAKFSDVSNLKSFKNFIHQAKEILWNANLSDQQLNPAMFQNLKVPKKIADLELNNEQQNELVRWIIGEKLSSEYADLLDLLDIHNSSDFSNVHSQRATAILVYDSNISPQQFLSAGYASEGIFSTLKFDGFQKIQN